MMKRGSVQANWGKRIIGCFALAWICLPVFGAVSPFERSKKTQNQAPVTATAATRLDEMQFTGMMAVGGETTFSLYDPKTKQSVWVPLSGSEAGVSVANFDEAGGRITVTLEGRSREIVINENEIVTLKRATRPQAAPRGPAVVPKAKKVVRQKDPETLKKEEQARNFVSDLLANGMEQRERYRRELEERIAKTKRAPSQR